MTADPPAAMVLDVMLPGLDGFSVVERMKTELPRGGPPVIMLTIVDEPERAARLASRPTCASRSTPTSSSVVSAA